MPTRIEFDDSAAQIVMKALLLDKVFPSLTAAEAGQLFPNSGLYSYVKDDYVIQQGEKSKDLYVITSGSVAITQTFGTAAGQLATLRAGQLFGEIALVAEGVRIASVVAGEKTEIYRLVQSDIQKAMDDKPGLAEHLRDLARKRLSD